MTPSTSDFPSADDVLAIASQPDAVRRNLWITWSYYRLNRAMSAIIGDSDLSWCGFATWASKTAGRFIRQEELGPFIELWLANATERAGLIARWTARLLGLLHPGNGDGIQSRPLAQSSASTGNLSTPAPAHFSLRAFARMAIAQVGDSIGAGNQDVFRHIAPPFAQSLALWLQHGGAIPEADRAAFLDTLKDRGGDDQGQYLFQAFEATFAAAATTDPRLRAQLMLQANALIGCAEQTRVQPFIVTSLNAPLEDLFHLHLSAHLHWRFFAPIAKLLHLLMRPLGEALEKTFQDLSTQLLMTLQLPDQALRLGVDVPPLPDGQMYPTALTSLDAPTPLQLLEQLNAVNDVGSAAKDWASYADRMRYIGVLFRSRQQQRLLWDAPFTDAQIGALQDGRVPTGPL
jgi:hypothetical protein